MTGDHRRLHRRGTAAICAPTPDAWIELAKSLGIEDPRAANLVRDRTVNRLQTEWNEEIVARQIRALEFIQKYVGAEFLETIDPTALTTKYMPRSS